MDKELEIILSLYLEDHETSDHDKMLAEYIELNPGVLSEVQEYLRDHVTLQYILGEDSDNLSVKIEKILGAQFKDGDDFSENIKNRINSRKRGRKSGSSLAASARP